MNAKANEATAEKWARTATANVNKRLGHNATLLTDEMVRALICAQLVGLIAAQDEVQNGATMRLACELVMTED